jgi:hypothetical protein
MKRFASRGGMMVFALLSVPLAAGAQPKLTSESQLSSPEDAAAKRKLQPFIHCLNTVSNDLSNLVRPYREMYDAVNKDPANGADRSSWNTQYQYSGGFMFRGNVMTKENAVVACADALDAAVKLPPVDASLDAVGQSFGAGLRRLDALALKVEAYFNQKDYRDDRMEHGRAFNAEYDPLLQHLVDDTRRMSAEVQQRYLVQERHRLDAIERLDGRHMRWEANAFLLQARTSLNALTALAARKALTRDAVLAQTTPLEDRFKEASEYAAAHPGENNDDMDLWSRILNYATAMVTAAKEARRDADDPRAASRVPDHIGTMRYQFNNLVGQANIAHR